MIALVHHQTNRAKGIACPHLLEIGKLKKGDKVPQDEAILRNKANIIDWRFNASKRLAEDTRQARWYVVGVAARREKIVSEDMELSGIQVWLPTKKERIRCGRAGGKVRYRDIDISLFDGYLFIRCRPSAKAWLGIMSFDHVVRILGDDSGPAVMEDKYLEKLKALVEKNVFDFSTGKNRYWTDKPVRIDDGPFLGFQGIVDKSYKGGVMLPILVSVMGRETKVEISVDSVSDAG